LIPIGAHELDVGAGVNETILHVALHAIGDGERDDQRCDTGGDSGDGDAGDNADDGLPPLGFEVPRRHKKFKSHRARFYFDADPVTTDLARPTFSCLS
jgi:hypothetical protein